MATTLGWKVTVRAPRLRAGEGLGVRVVDSTAGLAPTLRRGSMSRRSNASSPPLDVRRWSNLTAFSCWSIGTKTETDGLLHIVEVQFEDLSQG